LPHLWPTGSSWGRPLDYGPVLLRKPFGFHLAVDTLSSGCLRDRPTNLGASPWLSPSFPTSCPFRVLLIHAPRPTRRYPRLWIWRPSSERQRDFNPPDLGAAQHTLRTHLTARRRACRPYRPRRSPTVPRQVMRTPLGSPGSRVWNFHACSGSSTPPQTPAPHLSGVGVVAFSRIEQDRPAKVFDFGVRWLACVFHPTGRFDESRYRLPPSVGGRSDWLRLLRRTLSFPIPNRFIPAHSISNSWPPCFRLLAPCSTLFRVANSEDYKSRHQPIP
jgi:hypothetical protein